MLAYVQNHHLSLRENMFILDIITLFLSKVKMGYEISRKMPLF